MTDTFLRALAWLWPVEGGWWPGGRSDPNPTMYGITARTFAAAQKRYGWFWKPVREITKDEAQVIYWVEYWTAGRCGALPWPMSLVHFDACVNHGVGNAGKLRARVAGGGWKEYIAVRRKFYADIIEANPDLAPNAKGWENRMKRLEKTCADS